MELNAEVASLVNQATIALTQQDYTGALNAYAAALKIAQELKRSRLIAVLLNRTGQVFQAQGKVQDAVIAYESALRALAGETDLELQFVDRQLSRVSKGYANNYSDSPYAINHPEPVPDLYSASVAATLEADENDATLVVKLWLNIGNAYLQQPQENPALNAYEQALQRPEIEKNLLLKAYALANIGEIYRRQNRIDESETALNQAIQLFDQQADPLDKRRALALLASIARDRNQIGPAIDLYQQALSLYEQANDPRGLGRTCAGLANLYRAQKQYREAQQFYSQAVTIAEAENDQETLWYIYWGLGCCQHYMGELQTAIISFEKSLQLIDQRQQNLRTDEGKVAFLDNVQEVFEKLLMLHLELAQAGGQDYQPALEIAERARGQALQDLMQGRRRQRSRLMDPQPAPLPKSNPLDDFQPAPWHDSDITNSPVQMAAGSPVWDISRIEQAAPAVSSFSLDSLDFNALPEPEQPPPALAPLTRLVYYCLTDRTAIFAVTPDGQVKGHVVPLGDAAIAVQVTQLRRALQVDGVNRGVDLRKAVLLDQVKPVDITAINLEVLLQDLYNTFVAPVADALPADGSPVAIEPHCSLWLVPFAALKLEDGDWMGDRWPLIYAASATTLEEIRQEPCYAPLENARLLAVGNPVMPTVTLPNGSEVALSPLAGAEAEVKAIAHLFPEDQRTLLIQTEATEAQVKTLALTHNIVHLATHGLAFGRDPLASLVAFSPTEQENGLLTAREVMQSADLPADLVVLSACQTGLGRITGEGMLGLSRAFLVAGARSVMVSQWSVSDSATMELMVAFYQHYLNSGNKAVALQKAIQKVRSQLEYCHPRYWAPFTLVGAEL